MFFIKLIFENVLFENIYKSENNQNSKNEHTTGTFGKTVTHV